MIPHRPLLITQERHGSDEPSELDIEETWQANPGASCAAVIHHEAIKRNKRLMLAYAHHRLNVR